MTATLRISSTPALRPRMRTEAPDAARRGPFASPSGIDRRVRSRVAFLAQVPIFAVLSQEDLLDLAGICYPRTFRPGEVLCHEGDPANALYLIEAGQVKIVRDTPEGEEVIVHLLGPGECMGELALLDAGPRSATAQALDSVEALILPQEAFLALLERRPEVTRAVILALVGIVRRVTEQLQDLLILDVPARIAKTLLSLATRYGEPTTDGIRIRVRLTQEELAQMVGAARPTVTKELGGFRQRGILSLDREGFTLHEPEQLRQRIY
jgi:CRP/FNR family cyclic AMP-dependent transcriptional regulator